MFIKGITIDHHESEKVINLYSNKDGTEDLQEY